MRQLFFFFFLLSLISIVKAQETPSDSQTVPPAINKIRYKSTSLSVPYRIVRDEGHSPLFHRGPSLQVAAYNERFRANKSVTKFEMVIGFGILKTNKNRVSAVTRAQLINLEINYHYLYPIKKIFRGRGEWYIGAISTNTIDGRLYAFLPNNSFGYEFSNAFNPATHLTYNFKFGKGNREYQAGFKLNFSLLAHVIRPNYIGMEPQQVYEGETINTFAFLTTGNTLALPNRFFRINTELYLDRLNLYNKNKVRLFYGWGLHITKLQESNPLYYINHTVGIVSMIYSEKTRKSKRNSK